MVATGPKMNPGSHKMAQDRPKIAHIHANCDSYTFLPPQVPETSFFTTNRGGEFSGGVRRIATNRDESRGIAGVGPLNITNTLQTGKEHSNTPQRAGGTVADMYITTYMYTHAHTHTSISTYI